MRIPIESLTFTSKPGGNILITLEITPDQIQEIMALAIRPDDDLPRIHLSDSELSSRVRNRLDAAGIYTLRQLAGTRLKQVRLIPGMGPQGVQECREFLAKHNRELA